MAAHPHTAPKILRPNDTARIPQALRDRDQWVLWRLEWDGHAWAKVPTHPNGHNISAPDPKNHLSFEEAWQHWQRGSALRKRGVKFAGVGFVPMPDDDIICVDLDRAFHTNGAGEREVTDVEAVRLLKRAKEQGLFYEVSVGGQGFHIWCRGTASNVSEKDETNVEIFTSGRFIAIVGGVGDLLPAQDILDAALALVEARRQARGKGPLPTAPAPRRGAPGALPGDLSDLTGGLHSDGPFSAASIIEECPVFNETARTGGKGQSDELWRNGILNILARCDDGEDYVHPLSKGWVGKDGAPYDPDEADRKFAHAVKDIEKGVGPARCSTIRSLNGNEPCDSCPHAPRDKTGDFDTDHGFSPLFLGEARRSTSGAACGAMSAEPVRLIEDDPEPDPHEVTEVDVSLMLAAPPPMRDYIEWWLSVSSNAEPAYAFTSCLLFFATIIGKVVRSETDARCNHNILTNGPTESGKKAVFRLYERAIRAVQQALLAHNYQLEPERTDLTLFGGSREGMWWRMADNNGNLNLHSEEFGKLLVDYARKRLPSHEQELVGQILYLFDAAERAKVIPLMYSQRNKNARQLEPIAYPFANVVGTGTPRTFEELGSAIAEEGFLNRFLILQCRGAAPIRNPHWKPLPQSVIDWAVNFTLKHWAGQPTAPPAALSGTQLKIHTIPFGPGAANLDLKLREQGRKRANKGTVGAGCWGRYNLRSQKLAMLAACAEDPVHPVITKDLLLWAAKVVAQANKYAAATFAATGALGEDEYERMAQAVLGTWDAPGIAKKFKGKPKDEWWLTRKDLSRYAGRAWSKSSAGRKKEEVLDSLVADGYPATKKGQRSGLLLLRVRKKRE